MPPDRENALTAILRAHIQDLGGLSALYHLYRLIFPDLSQNNRLVLVYSRIFLRRSMNYLVDIFTEWAGQSH